MKKFKIKYIDPEDGETWKEEIHEFEDTENVTAEEWAEDLAYARADKGEYKVEELFK